MRREGVCFFLFLFFGLSTFWTGTRFAAFALAACGLSIFTFAFTFTFLFSTHTTRPMSERGARGRATGGLKT